MIKIHGLLSKAYHTYNAVSITPNGAYSLTVIPCQLSPEVSDLQLDLGTLQYFTLCAFHNHQ